MNITKNPRSTTKKGGGQASSSSVGVYELFSSSELSAKGQHSATILLHGAPIATSPVTFNVRPTAPNALKSWLGARPGAPALANLPAVAVLHLVDRYGNACEAGGGVRIDAKVTYFGTKTTESQVADQEDGTYTITFVGASPGEYRITARLDNIEVPQFQMHVAPNEAAPESGQEQGASRVEEEGEEGEEEGGQAASSGTGNGADPTRHPKSDADKRRAESATGSSAPAAARGDASGGAVPSKKGSSTPSKGGKAKKSDRGGGKGGGKGSASKRGATPKKAKGRS